MDRKLLIAMGILILGIMLFFSLNQGTPPLNKENDKMINSSPVVLSEASDEMPKSSSYTYGVSQYQIISEAVNSGSFLRTYEITFKNTARRDYDIEKTYAEFSADMEKYSTTLKRGIKELQSQKPAQQQNKVEQAYALQHMQELYSTVKNYPKYVNSIHDTLNYIHDCKGKLDKLNNQMKLPQ